MDPISRGFFLGSAGAAGGDTPETVMSIDEWTGNETARSITNGIDLAGEGGIIITHRASSSADRHIFYTASGMGVGKYLEMNKVTAAITDTDTVTAFNSNGFSLGVDTGNVINGNGHDYAAITIRKMEGFMDVVEYSGNATNRTISHSLNAVPEMMIIKNKGPFTENWAVYHKAFGNTHVGKLIDNDAPSSDSAVWNNTTPTSSVFSVGTDDLTNRSGQSYIAILFASLDGFCKVGSYTGSSSPVNVDCRDFFSGAPRIVLIKGVDIGGDWMFIYELNSGNDKYFIVNGTGSSDTNDDDIDPHANGFTINRTGSSDWNSNTRDFSFIAIK